MLSCYIVLMCVEVIDAGLRRCGRFDREVAMHVPDEKVCCCACLCKRVADCIHVFVSVHTTLMQSRKVALHVRTCVCLHALTGTCGNTT